MSEPLPLTEEEERDFREFAFSGNLAGAMVPKIGVLTVRRLFATLDRARAERDEARANADFLRESIGECHLMISRNTPEYQLKQTWEAVDLPPRLRKIMLRAESAEKERDNLAELVNAAAGELLNGRRPSEVADMLFASKERGDWQSALDEADNETRAAEARARQLAEALRAIRNGARLDGEQIGVRTRCVVCGYRECAPDCIVGNALAREGA